MTEKRARALFIVAFLAPAFTLFTTFVAWPGAHALLYSLRKWNGLSEPTWVGLANFARLFREGDVFPSAFKHNASIMLLAGSAIMALSLAFAAMLHRQVRGAALFRIAFFFPNVLASVAVALLWILLYSATDFGVFNALLAHVQAAWNRLGVCPVHLALPYPFLDSKHLILSLAPMVVWAATGFYMILFLAAMEGIPESYYEAAQLDGATAWQQFRHITLPLIREVLIVGVVFLMISVLKFFDPVWVMENQRPSHDSHVLATLLYQKAFEEYNVGYGSAVAVVLFVLIFCCTLLSLRLSRAERIEY